MKRIIVTGSTGFLGGYFLKYIADKAEVLTVSTRKSSNVDVILDSEYEKDVLAKVIAEFEPDLIYHLAGLIKSTDINAYYRVNLHYSATVLSAASVFQNTKIVLLGSSAEYGKSVSDDLPLCENSNGYPYNHYGASKLAQTQLAFYYVKLGRRIWLPRLFNLIGPGQDSDFVIGKVINSLVDFENKEFVGDLDLGYLGDKRDFVDVRDVCPVLWGLPDLQALEGRIVNICTGNAITIREVVEEVISQSRSKLKINERKANELPRDIHYGDARLLETMTGYKLRLNLHKIIKDMLQVARSSHRLS